MKNNLYKVGKVFKSWREGIAQTVTFIVTEDCNLRCKYCYISHKQANKTMSVDTGIKFIDYLFSPEFSRSEAVIIEFIGGEPLIAVEVIDEICDYFKLKAFEMSHVCSWYWNYRINICTNGVNFSDPKVQKFIDKNFGKMSLGITIDGTKEKHDLQRVFENGQGSYDIIEKNIPLWLSNFKGSTKVTFASDDLIYLKDSIISLWNKGITNVAANVVFENVWKQNDDLLFEKQLKELADYILDKELFGSYYCTLFDENVGNPYGSSDLVKTSCGAGKMIALSPDGTMLPCLRYKNYSLNKQKQWDVGVLKAESSRNVSGRL